MGGERFPNKTLNCNSFMVPFAFTVPLDSRVLGVQGHATITSKRRRGVVKRL